MTSGLTARGFILQQLTAVAQHSPFRSVVAAALANQGSNDVPGGAIRSSSNTSGWWRGILVRPERSRGAFTLMTEEEMEFLRRRREEDGDESRVVLATRPTRQILRGFGGCVLNVTVSFFISPILALSVALEAVRLRGVRPSSFIIAPIAGLTWGSAFAIIAWYAAAQQLILCAIYQCAAPVVYLFCKGLTWGELACRYEYLNGTVGHTHPLLSSYDPDVKIQERAMRREAARRRRSDKQGVQYSRKANSKSGEHDDEDYYAILGISRDVTPGQVKEAYNRLVLKVHPDKNPSRQAAAEFDRITKAYRVLSNAERRRKYDLGGTSGVEGLGEKKRGAVRALFGGDELFALVGDVRVGSFSQRVVDGLDFTQEELAVRRQRMLQSCRDVLLLSYLEPMMDSRDNGASAEDVRRQLRRVLGTGLAKEVLHAVGQEYLRVAAYSTARGPIERLHIYASVLLPHRTQRRMDKWRCLSRVRQHTFKDSAAMVDLAWYTSVEEIEATSRWVATAVLMDPKLPEETRRSRCEALHALGETFVKYGQPYKGANQQTMNSLMDSLREYQQEQRRRKEDL